MMMEPKIRFKGFSGEWENTSLGQAAFDFKYGINAAAKEYDGHNKYLRITDIDDSSREFCYDDLTSPNTDLTNCNDYLMKVRDIVVARTGASVGKTYKYSEKDETVYFAGFLIRFTANNDYDSDFVFYNTLTKGYDKHIKLVSQRSGQPGVNVSELQSFAFNAPSLPEQRALATFFTSLDNQISAAEKRLASLKQVKAASLQAMFPQEGETTPKLRFKGCEGEWKKVKLGEMYEPRNDKNDLSFGVNDIISVANMYFRPISYVSNDDYLKSYNIFRVGDIAFEGHKSKNFSHGRFVENSIGDGIVSHVFVVLKRKDKQFDVDFWKYYINNERIMCGILTRSTKSSTMMNDIVVSDFLKESILVPSYEEQVKIGNYFTSLDRQISAQSSKISKLKQIKSACLDQMFV